MKHNRNNPSATRRQFLTTSVAAAGAAAMTSNLSLLSNVHAGGGELIRVGLVGCGGRGTGAAEQCVNGGPNVRLVAMGDTFRDRLQSTLNRFNQNERMRGKVDVPAERQFVGLDAYQQVINNCDLVILATPPGFRPMHIAAAVNANKHIFTEKPVAVDGAGIRSVLESCEQANQRRLCIVSGNQRRYQTGYLESMQRIHNGDIGDITSARCYWNQGALWSRERTSQMSPLEWQIRNWLYFTWLSGDHIVEQHIHNIDVVNWAMRTHPIAAVAVGGRQVRTADRFGHIYDHFAVDFEYPNDVHAMSMCRQIEGCVNNVSEAIVGTRGKWNSSNYRITGERQWSFPRRQDNDPYQEEHNILIRHIRQSQPINTLRDVAHSTLAAIMGRMAAYTGQRVTWEEALASESTMPRNLNWDMELPVPAVPMPGRA